MQNKESNFMINEITIRFSGEQGSGVQYTGKFAASYLNDLGYDVFAVNDFESRIRGGYSFVQLRVGINPGYSIKREPDLLFVYSKSVIERDLETISPDTIIILSKEFYTDKLKYHKTHLVNFNELLKKDESKYINTFFVAVVSGIFNTDFETLKKTLISGLEKKGTDVIDCNLSVAHAGYKQAAILKIESFKLHKPNNSAQKTKPLSGSHVLSAGIVAANCRFYSAYPMSPATSIMEHLSDWSKEFNIVVEQAEDEIAAINLAIGASYAGVRAMTGTSGGGMALMSEAVSLAAVSETPIVIANAQRPGPGTGLPTKTEQSDLLFTLFMGHGEFTKIILAPGTHEKAFELAQKAFYLADKYQVPVFILTDQYFMDSLKSCKKLRASKVFQERFIDFNSDNETPYLRYKLTNNGISPRKIPGYFNKRIVGDSHTHDESGMIAELSRIKIDMTDKLLKKKEAILKDIEPPYISNKNLAKNIVIGWGSTFGVLDDAIKILNQKGYQISHIHFHELYPLSCDCLKQNNKSNIKKIICVENNATGQFANLLKMEQDIIISDKILKYDGRPFYLNEIIYELERKLQK